MKLQGVFGKGSGKVGASVWAISGGEQIVREYNKEVSNPNTDAQVAQRAKLKLMSQLGAALGPALGFTKQGLISARNQFVSKNIGLCTYENNQAMVDLEELQLTPSSVSFVGLNVTFNNNVINAALANAAAGDIKRVAYFVFKQNGDSQLEYVASKIVAEAGEGRTFPTTFNVGGGEFVVYAYGIKDNSVNATIRYEDYVSAPGDNTSTLDVISLFRSADYGLTKSVASLVES